MIKLTARRALLASTIIAGAMIALPAAAQNAAPAAAAADASDDSQTIVVTGSRIARPELQSTVPIAVVSTEAIKNTGASNIQDVLAELPAVGQNISRTSSNFSNTGNGVATVNLRNLGSSRTLVLINGRRTVGIAGSSSADLNNIPTDLIKRVEVVTGGASAVYGSDAISGVVNFVLDDKFEGLRLHAQNTISDKGDTPRQLASVTGGLAFADGRGHIVGNFSYDKDHGLKSRDRNFSAHDIPNNSSYAAQGLFSLDGTFNPSNGQTYTFSPTNTVKPYQGANIDGYNRNSVRYLSVPVERYLASGLASFDISSDLTAYAEGTYSKVRSSAGLEASALANTGPGAITNFDGSPLSGISVTNPYVPAEIAAAAAAAGVTTIPFRRRSVDIFSRSNKDDRDFYRGVVGLKGNIGSKFHFDASFEHSESKDHTVAGDLSTGAYGAALNAGRDASGNIVCLDPAAVAAGCVPINIFGYNTVSAAAAAFVQKYVGPTVTAPDGQVLKTGTKLTFDYLARVKQDDASVTFNGELFDLPGGPFAVAVGGEYRHESSSEIFGAATQLGLGTGNQLSNTVGAFNVKEGFVEVSAPLLKERAFIYDLRLEGAFRYADYSTIGGVKSFKVGGEYAPVSDIRFRAVYAQATRAPNISELFSAQSQTFPAVTDPCDQGGGVGDGATLSSLPASCAAIPAIAATVARTGKFSYTTAQIQTIDGLTGGNINLKQETAKTLTLGGVFTPHWVRNFSLSVDYYHIKVKDAIGIIGQQVSLDQCFQTNSPTFCSNIVRDANGYVTRVNAINLNTGGYLVAGLDIQANYRTSLEKIKVPGALDVDIFWNHLLKQQQTPFPGGPVQNELGQADCYSCGRLGSGPRDKINASVTYSLPSGFSLNYRLNYLSALRDDITDPGATRVSPYAYHNLQVRFAFGEGRRFEFYTGVNNLTDKQPPVFGDTNPVTWPGTQTVADTYDLYGRLLYAGFDVKF
jgi:iron complex outermembrane receptor protein